MGVWDGNIFFPNFSLASIFDDLLKNIFYMQTFRKAAIGRPCLPSGSQDEYCGLLENKFPSE